MKKKSIKNVSVKAIRWLIQRHKIEPVEGRYYFTDAMVKEGLDLGKAARMLQPIWNMYVLRDGDDYFFRETI